MKVGYVLSEYPKVSHTFIRREIEAVEACGVAVERFAIRDGGAVIDPLDLAEAQRTRFVLAKGAVGLLMAGLKLFLRKPGRSLSAFWLACKMGRGAERPMPFHWIYFLEAAVVANWVRVHSIDHLHAHFGSNPTEVAMLAADLAGVTYSFTAHGTVETDNAKAIGLPLKVQHAAFVVAVCDYGRAQMMRWVPASQWSKMHVVRCGLGTEYLDAIAEASPPDAGFLAIGRLSEEKGHLCLIEAFARLLSTGLSCRLVLAGDGPLRQGIEQRCRELGIAEHVHITGWASGSQVRQLIKDARALVLPSFAEGLPVVLMEAMAMARPVVASWVAGIPELVEGGCSGWLVPPGNVEELERAMLECARSSQELCENMGREGQQRVVRQHDAQVEGRKLARLFQSIDPG